MQDIKDAVSELIKQAKQKGFQLNILDDQVIDTLVDTPIQPGKEVADRINSPILADVLIQSDFHSYYAHKKILVRYPYFKAMFNGFKESMSI